MMLSRATPYAGTPSHGGPCSRHFSHRSCHASRGLLDHLPVLPAKELRTHPGGAIFSRRDAKTLTYKPCVKAIAYAGRVVWGGPAGQPLSWPLHSQRLLT
jgi:hypothetical protein